MGELFFGKYLVTAAEEMPEEMEVYSGWGVAVLDGKILEIGANSDLKKMPILMFVITGIKS